MRCSVERLNQKSEETANGPRHLPSAVSYTLETTVAFAFKLEMENDASVVP